jgi:hypothetical protein
MAILQLLVLMRPSNVNVAGVRRSISHKVPPAPYQIENHQGHKPETEPRPINALSGQSMKLGTAVRKLALVRYSAGTEACAVVECGAKSRVKRITRRVTSPRCHPSHGWRAAICRSVTAFRLRTNTKYTEVLQPFGASRGHSAARRFVQALEGMRLIARLGGATKRGHSQDGPRAVSGFTLKQSRLDGKSRRSPGQSSLMPGWPSNKSVTLRTSCARLS